MKKIVAALGFAFVLLAMLGIAPSVAQIPQFPQTLPANTVVGRTGVSSGPAQAIPFSTLSTFVGAGTNGATCPATLGIYQPFTNTTSAPTGTTLNIFDGSQCVQWGTLNQTQHLITFEFPGANQTVSTSLQPFTWWNVTESGTLSAQGIAGVTANHIFNATDNLAAAAETGVFNGYWGVVLNSASITGGRTNLFSLLEVTHATGNTNTNFFYVSHAAQAMATVNDNGTSGTPSGSLFAGNDIAQLQGTATFWKELTGREFDCEVDSGASVEFKQCVKIVLFGADANQGSVSDYGLGFVKQSTATGSFKTGITFGEPTGWWPISSTGTIIGTNTALAGGPSYSAALGVDLSAVSFSSGSFKGPGFLVNGGGQITTGTNGGTGGQLNVNGSTSGSFAVAASSTGSPLYGGTITNDSATSGNIGEIITSTVASPGSSVTSGTPSNVTSVSLTAGDWDVSGQCNAIPASTTTQSQLFCSLNTTSATSNVTAGFFFEGSGIGQTGSFQGQWSANTPVARFSLSATTSVFLVQQMTFGTSTETVWGTIRARRVR